jgi:prepilin-type N-terminal cleavage/methylation domain-containing protein
MMKIRQFVKGLLRNGRGFTLIEIIAVLVILLILTAVAVSRSMSTQNDLIPQADIVKSHLRFAQLKALQDDVNAWSITFASTSYTLSCTGTNCPSSPIQLPAESSSTYTFPSGTGITITSTSSPLNFDSWGSPVGGAATVTLDQSGSTSIVITVDANTGYITP